ncbi:MAG: B12-binding domain-containing protein [Planctomycetota bacterium]
MSASLDLKSAPFAAELIRQSGQALAESVVTKLLQDAPARWQHLQRDSNANLKSRVATRLTYLSTALTHARSQIFVDSIAWTRFAWEARGMPPNDFAALLAAIRDVLVEQLPPIAAQPAAAFVAAGLEELKQAPVAPTSYMRVDTPTGRLAAEYLVQLLEGKQQNAFDLVLSAVDRGLPVRSAYMEVVVPAQQELGRLWMLDEISIGEEHQCTAASMRLLTLLHAHAPRGAPQALSVLGAAVSDNQHELGIRVIMDFFDLEGWRSVYLASGVPVADLCKSLHDFDADLLALSVTLTPQIESARCMIAELRSQPEICDMPVMVGGGAFAGLGDLWREIGGDAYVNSPFDAVRVGHELVARRQRRH